MISCNSFHFVGIGGGTVSCSAWSVANLYPTLLTLSFSDIFGLVSSSHAGSLQDKPRNWRPAHQECKINKIKSQVFMTAPRKLPRGARQFQFPIAFKRHPNQWSLLIYYGLTSFALCFEKKGVSRGCIFFAMAWTDAETCFIGCLEDVRGSWGEGHPNHQVC